MCESCYTLESPQDQDYTQAESQGWTHRQELWTTGQGLLVSVAFIVMVLAMFFVSLGG